MSTLITLEARDLEHANGGLLPAQRRILKYAAGAFATGLAADQLIDSKATRNHSDAPSSCLGSWAAKGSVADNLLCGWK